MKNNVVNIVRSGSKSKITWKVGKDWNRSRVANDEKRGKKHLTVDEINCIIQTIRKQSRYPDRDELMVLAAFHHGFRVSELTNLRWQHVDLRAMQMKINRIKNGINTTHPISHKRELMLLRRMHRQQGKPTTGFCFRNERGNAVSVGGFQKTFGKYSKNALGVQYNCHALRHSCATRLIEMNHSLRKVQIYCGHKSVQSTTVYLHESVKQFDSIEW